MHEILETRIKSAKAAERRIREALTQQEGFASTWHERAELAIRKGADDLAREALARRAQCLREKEDLLIRLSQAKFIRADLEAQLCEAVKSEAQAILVAVSEQLKAIHLEIRSAKISGNDLLVLLLKEKMEALLEKGRQAWSVAFEGAEHEELDEPPAWDGECERRGSSQEHFFAKEADEDLELLKRKSANTWTKEDLEELESLRRFIDRM